jgi:hypothetical protein
MTTSTRVPQGTQAPKSQCKCINADLNFSDSKLKLIFVAHARFSDGASSLIKSETTWRVKQEEPLSMQINLVKKENKEEIQFFKGIKEIKVKSTFKKVDSSSNDSKSISKAETYVLTLIFTNRLMTPVHLLLNEKSFKFAYEMDTSKHTNFGSLKMENKDLKEVYLKPNSKESMSVSFVPLKSGIIQIEKVLLKDKISGKKFTFISNFSLLID